MQAERARGRGSVPGSVRSGSLALVLVLLVVLEATREKRAKRRTPSLRRRCCPQGPDFLLGGRGVFQKLKRRKTQRQEPEEELQARPPRPSWTPGPPGARGPTAPGLPLPPLLLQQLRGLAEGACLHCGPPLVSVWFSSRLQSSVSVPRRSLLELQSFTQVLSGSRGPSLSSGRFTAPVSGFYQLTASLLMESGDRVQVRARDHVRAAICIQSLCQTNLSVAAVTAVAASGGTFSVLLTGTLHLQVGEYLSVFVDNGSGSSLRILPSSTFSGLLLGV